MDFIQIFSASKTDELEAIKLDMDCYFLQQDAGMR
jgi:hypothetical protein